MSSSTSVRDWSPLLSKLSEMQVGAEREMLVEELLDGRLDGYLERNERCVGALCRDLGAPAPVADAELHEVAAANARINLTDALEKGSKMTAAYTGELLSQGWRNALLSDVAVHVIQGGQETLRNIARNSGNCRRLDELNARYGEQQVVDALRRFTVWFRLLAAYKKGRAAGTTLFELCERQLEGTLR